MTPPFHASGCIHNSSDATAKYMGIFGEVQEKIFTNWADMEKLRPWVNAPARSRLPNSIQKLSEENTFATAHPHQRNKPALAGFR